MSEFGFFDLPDEVFAFSDLKEDTAYRRIPRQKRRYYLQEPIRLGGQAAIQYRGRDLERILRDSGVSVQTLHDGPPGYLHAQILYDGDRREVQIYTAVARRLSEVMAETPFPFTPEQLQKLFLAHEFYHWLEYSSQTSTDSRCEPVEVRLLGLFRSRVRIRRTSEIAAFQFAKEFCQLSIHPKIMDYVLLYRERGAAFAEIDRELSALRSKYEEECL